MEYLVEFLAEEFRRYQPAAAISPYAYWANARLPVAAFGARWVIHWCDSLHIGTQVYFAYELPIYFACKLNFRRAR